MNKLIATAATTAVLFTTLGAPTQAEARTKDVIKYGAIGLGALALSNALSQPSYGYGYSGGYYPASSYYYSQPSYGGYYNYPSYSYDYAPSYSYYDYSPGYSSGYYYY